MADATPARALPDLAALIGLDLPEECLPGVIANLDALKAHWDRLREDDGAAA